MEQVIDWVAEGDHGIVCEWGGCDVHTAKWWVKATCSGGCSPEVRPVCNRGMFDIEAMRAKAGLLIECNRCKARTPPAKLYWVLGPVQ